MGQASAALDLRTACWAGHSHHINRKDGAHGRYKWWRKQELAAGVVRVAVEAVVVRAASAGARATRGR